MRGKRKMKEIRNMSGNQKIKMYSDLLPDYYKDDKKLAIDRLKKACYYETTKGKTIANQLKEIEFDITQYEELDRFLFQLTYMVLTHSKRKVLKREESRTKVLPNQKLIKNIKDINVDSKIEKLVIYFWVVGGTYENLKIEPFIQNEETLIKKFNEHLFFADKRFRNVEYYKDERMRGYSDNSSDKEVKENLKDIKMGLNEVTELYDKEYYDILREDKQKLYKSLQIILEIHSAEICLGFLNGIIDKLYLREIQRVNKLEATDIVVFLYMSCMRFMIDTFSVSSFKNLVEYNQQDWLEQFDSLYKKIFEWLNEVQENIIRDKYNSNVFFHFAMHVYMIYFKRYFEYLNTVSMNLIREDKENYNSSKKEYKDKTAYLESYINDSKIKELIECLNTGSINLTREDKDKIIYSESYINHSKIKELMEYILPNETERKLSDRNEIRNRLKYVLKVMDKLAKKNPIFKEKRYAKNVKIMYHILYGDDKGNLKLNKQMPKKLYQGKIIDIKNSESIILIERYIYERYVNEGKTAEYLDYLNKRRDMLTQCIEMLESVIEMKNDVNGENKIRN